MSVSLLLYIELALGLSICCGLGSVSLVVVRLALGGVKTSNLSKWTKGVCLFICLHVVQM